MRCLPPSFLLKVVTLEKRGSHGSGAACFGEGFQGMELMDLTYQSDGLLTWMEISGSVGFGPGCLPKPS